MAKFDFIEDADLRAKVENEHKIEVDTLTVNLTNATKTQVEEAVAGLKTKNAEILTEKKTLQEQMKALDFIKDPKAAKEALEFYEKNKDVEFLKDGTVDELIEKKTSQLTSDYEVKITELSEQLNKTKKHGETYQTLFESKVIDDGLRNEAIKQGVRPEAIDDVVLRGRSIFTLDQNKQIEARDAEGKLAVTEDKKVLTPQNWVMGLKDSSPHYWPGSEGAGAFGGRGGADNDADAKLIAVAESGDADAYRAMRDKKRRK